jgi:ornithine carbamoyltransferase
MLKYDAILALDDAHVMGTYRRMPALFVQGSGSKLWDNRGNEYLDLLAGIAVCQLGHCHPAVVAAIMRQAQQLIHTSNLLLTAPQARLAQRLCTFAGMDRAFFAVCGATANEAAIKIARKHAKRTKGDDAIEIVTLERSFHGRTMGALSATGNPAYQSPFAPVVPGFRHVPADDIAALRDAVGPNTAAVLLETVMGESGVYDLSPEFLRAARDLCDAHGALLMLDEVQAGIGRTGKWFAYQHTDVVPDVVCLAKGLGGGVPIGAVLARGAAATVLEPGDHGSTFGGNPLACAAALAVLETIDHQDLLVNVATMGEAIRDRVSKMPGVTQVRGKGLMIGIRLAEPKARQIVADAFEAKLILNATDDFTLRMVPALTISPAEVNDALQRLARLLKAPAPAVIEPAASELSLPRYHDVLSIDDLLPEQLQAVLTLAAEQKNARSRYGRPITQLENRSVAMVFEKPSLRTRVSFETAITELGGHPIYLTKADIGMGSREAIRDVSMNLARWCSLIVARLYWHRHLVEMAECADVPVVNALTEWEHPCQALADMLTIQEAFGEEKVKIAYVGDGNNVARSLAKLATRMGYPMSIVGPANFQLEPMDGLTQTAELEAGLDGAHVVYTDVWISMGDEHEQEHRLKVFAPYQVNERVMGMADPRAIFLHCLPARRGYEVSDEVIDGHQSRVNDQAENRLHAQKALLSKIMNLT